MSWCLAADSRPVSMKRRNPDTNKLRKLKRNRLADGVCSGSLIYMKLLVAWTLLLMADFLLGFRFEYLWPFWLLLRSIYDSFRYQGVAFSVFFVCITVTSDLVCFLFIPVQWLFFLASTYVWVQYVWHADRGICLPTVSLWLLFIYVEASVRLKELSVASRAFPFTLDLCRPFAAHCIGYPVVTLGFGVKSYVGYKFRLRKQREVGKENAFYDRLLAEALPAEYEEDAGALRPVPDDADVGTAPDTGGGTTTASSAPSPLPLTANGRGSHASEGLRPETVVSTAAACLSWPGIVWRRLWDWLPASAPTDDDDEDEAAGSTPPAPSSNAGLKGANRPRNKNPRQRAPTRPIRDSSQSQCSQQTSYETKDSPVQRGGARVEDDDDGPRAEEQERNKAAAVAAWREASSALESELERLRGEVRGHRALEADLRAQLSAAASAKADARSDAATAKAKADHLEHKLANLVKAREQERNTVQTLEKKLVEEQRQRSQLESSLAAERKKETAKSSARGECSEACRAKRRDLEAETRRTRGELRAKEEQLVALEPDLKELQLYRERDRKEEQLLADIAMLQERNNHLQKSLSAENRLKQDLFSALGEANRRVELAQKELAKKTQELQMASRSAVGLGRASPADEGWGLGPLTGGNALGLGNGPASPEMDHNLHALAAVAAASHAPFLSNGLGGLGNGLGGLVDENGAACADSSSPALSFTPPRSH